MHISRDQFCLLTNMKVERLKSRTRRFQMPFDSDEAERKRHGYSFFDAFLTISVLELGDFPLMLDPVRAAETVKGAAPSLAQSWAKIIESGEKILRGVDHNEIIWSRWWFPGGLKDVAVGTTQQIARRGASHKSPVVVQISQSASRAAAVLIAYAESHGIEIPEEVRTAKIGGAA
jgi:hypothetical protein